ncbi:excinuclease ABC subunit UvrA [Nonomuraea africana]|uniref:UvrABC system protein A n=1 Tax=Nonomuraea africana TaxID=46171 RepID=A0ABR9KD28_9ACTN|nr:excinuclease ABC subunit UvrA [Nonomuraea africana]MBE1559706.1 excinuclease UvrABC ATPase subunit [Nonomuraea africana]
MSEAIVITGARTNNLKNVSLRIPKNRLVVFTGVSGSGKSSIVFDTIAVESQRQLNETFPTFVRNRLPRYEKPEAEAIEHLSAAIVVDQKPIGGNARSTVGTMTDISSILRVLFSRYGEPSAGYSFAYSFNDPQGMCPECDGLGRRLELDLGAFLDEELSLEEGAIRFPLFGVGTWQWQIYARSDTFDPAKPLKHYTDAERELFLHGQGFSVAVRGKNGTLNKVAYEGVADRFTRLYLKRDLSELSGRNREAVLAVVSEGVCRSCGGARLNAKALASRIGGHSIADYGAMEVTDLIAELGRLDYPVAGAAVAALRRVEQIGLGYLSLDRETSTVSGGEAQRLKMVRHLGSSLTGMTYIFDEPSAGLHPADVHRMNSLLLQLRDQGNTVMVVEHDPQVIEIADHVIDLGPGAGVHGGQVVFEGPVAELTDTLTGTHLRRRTSIKEQPRTPSGWLTVEHASLHNLDDVSVRLPVGVLTAVTGVAGSGKSTLIGQVFVAAHPEAVVVDQGAIAVSSRSSPASAIGVMDGIRAAFAKANGVKAGLFSFNSAGACPECEGRGVIYTDLAFMDPVTRTCETCEGRRFNAEALSYRLRGRTIAEVLAMTSEQASAFFADAGAAAIAARLRSLVEVGLGYLTLGQPTSTLSGGERQRLKLAGELGRTGSLYVLDEPTTGLHLADVEALVDLLDRLVEQGNTVIVIEHDLQVIRRADWVIDLGPGGGRHGGRVLYEGPPAGLGEAAGSVTGRFLRS